MKKLLVQISFAVSFIGCNDHSKHETAISDTLQHANHNSPSSTPDSTITFTQIMGGMMQQMHSIKPIDNNDVDFVRMMTIHHQAAVEMSKTALKKGSDTAIKAFAQKVINDQDKEIKFMESFAKVSPKAASPNATAFQSAMNSSMMVMMKEATLFNNIDKDFATQMIPHHQSAVDMAKAYLAHGKTAELVTLCNNIIAAQTTEISWLSGWLAKH